MRYLTDLDLRTNLAAGRNVEQLLPERYEMDELVIRYVSIECNEPGSWKVRLREILDHGTPEFLDIYEFGSVDPDLPFGDEWMSDSIVSALRFAEDSLGATRSLYVNRGLVQDEYRDRYHSEW